MGQSVGDLDGLVVLAQIGQSPGVDQEKLGLGFPLQVTGVFGGRDFDGPLRIAQTTLAIGHERQIVPVPIHTEGGAEFAQSQTVVTHAIGDEGQGLPGHVDAGSLLGDPLGMVQGGFGVGFLQSESGQHMQTDVLRMLLAQPAQTLLLLLGKHGPLHAGGHLGLSGATVGIRVLGRIGDGPVGIATAVVIVGRRLTALVIAPFALVERTAGTVLVMVAATLGPAVIPAVAVATVIETIATPAVAPIPVAPTALVVMAARTEAPVRTVGTVTIITVFMVVMVIPLEPALPAFAEMIGMIGMVGVPKMAIVAVTAAIAPLAGSAGPVPSVESSPRVPSTITRTVAATGSGMIFYHTLSLHDS